MNVDHGNLEFYPHLVSEQSLIEPVLIDSFASTYPSIVNFYSEKFFLLILRIFLFVLFLTLRFLLI